MGPEHKENRHLADCRVSDDALWLAFRYVHGELAADEAKAFEEQLASEQSAREALAEAAKLSEMLCAAITREAVAREAVVVPSSRVAGPRGPAALGAPSGRYWRHVASWATASWAVVGTAACLALLLMINAFFDRANRGDNAGTKTVVNGNSQSPEQATSTQQLLAQAYVDAGLIVPEPMMQAEPPHEPEEGDGAEGGPLLPSLANDWIALGLIAAQSEGNKR